MLKMTAILGALAVAIDSTRVLICLLVWDRYAIEVMVII
jgi:hypothetical protein